MEKYDQLGLEESVPWRRCHFEGGKNTKQGSGWFIYSATTHNALVALGDIEGNPNREDIGSRNSSTDFHHDY